MVITENKIFHGFPFETSAFKVNVKQMTKAALALGLGKVFFVHTTFRMDTQPHTQANQEMRLNFLSVYMPWIYQQAWNKFALP